MFPLPSFVTSIFISSSWGPSSLIHPLSITMILVQVLSVDNRCAMIRVHPLACSSTILSSASCTTASALESRADVASSRKTMDGFRMIARAMASRCFWPPLSFTLRSPA
mmetsp:Transcript_84014/g.232843  ORF Transcript_84014/g.232843 Transcript_84014/m.232843 type:complete len:109 (+) Transcript_84014:487-813(+)